MSTALTKGFTAVRLINNCPCCEIRYWHLRPRRLHLEHAGRERSHFTFVCIHVVQRPVLFGSPTISSESVRWLFFCCSPLSRYVTMPQLGLDWIRPLDGYGSILRHMANIFPTGMECGWITSILGSDQTEVYPVSPLLSRSFMHPRRAD
jgi:hypothetical protein